MKKSTLIMVVSLLLAVALGVGGTMAYLQDTDEDVNVMTLGSVYITQNEQERDADGNLVPFTQEKPAYPAVGPVEWAEAGKGVDVNGTEYMVFTDELKNVIDKIVTVTNTGRSDAYVRTIVALEAPEYDPNDLIHVNVNGDIPNTPWAPVDIDGVQYVYSVFTYPDALAPQETSVPSLVQLFLDSEATNADVEKFGDTWEVLVLSQAVQTQGFADAETALNTAFGEVNAAKAAEWFGGDFGTDNVGTPGDKWPSNNPPTFVPEDAKTIANTEELAAALTAGGEYYLTADIELDAASTITIPADVETTLNMNGKSISIHDAKVSGNAEMFLVKGTLNVKEGTIEMEAEVNREWNAMSTIFDVTAGGVLNLEYVTIKHNGGTDMTFGVHLNNWGEVTLNVNNSEIMANYCAVRVFNSGYDMNNVTIKNSKLHGDNRAFWVHNYIGDLNSAQHSDEAIKARLNIDLINGTNEITNGTAEAPKNNPIRYGFGNQAIYYDAEGNDVTVR